LDSLARPFFEAAWRWMGYVAVHLVPSDRERFEYCEYSFISVMLPSMNLMQASRRLP
jgi:hypothetical protein